MSRGLLRVGLLQVGLCSIWLAACGAAPPKPAPVVAPAPDPRPARPAVAPFERPALPEPMHLAIAVTGTELRLHVVEQHTSPVVELRWVLPGGRAHEQAGSRWPEGTLQLAAELLTEGTRSHPGATFATAMAQHGVQLEVRPTGDAMVVRLQVLGHQLAPALALLREALVEPTFDAKSLASLKQQHAAILRNEQADANAVATRLARRLVYGDASAYGAMGMSAAGLAKVTRKHIQEAWAAAFALGDSDLIVVGDVQAEELRRQVHQLFAAVLRAPTVPPPAPMQAAEAACHLVDLPAAVQTAIVWASPGPPRAAPDWPLLAVANQVLGGSASSRLFQELRERQGLTYGISAGFEGLRHGGRWLVATDVATAKTAAALTAVEVELERARRQPPTDDELATAKRYLQGQFALALAMPGNVADLLATRAAYRLPDDASLRWFEGVAEATPAQVQASWQAWSPQPPQSVVLVGAAAAMRPGVDGRCPRLVLHDAEARQLRVLVGTDPEMGDDGRAQAFRIWARDPSGLPALARYFGDVGHAGAFRAQALATAVAQGTPVLQAARLSPDWPRWRAEVAPRLLPLLDGDKPEALGAGAVLLAMASTAADLAESVTQEVPAAVARWALADVAPGTPVGQVRANFERRLRPGDLTQLGTVVLAGHLAALATLIGADTYRNEVAQLLLKMGSPEAARALVRGYRQWLAAGGVPNADDIAALAAVDGPDGLLLLFETYARLTTASEAAVASRVMQALRAELPRRMKGGVSDFEPFAAPLEALLSRPVLDDRWWAAGWLVRGQGLAGLRKTLDGLPADDSWRSPDGATRKALLHFAREVVAPLDRRESQPLLLAAVHARSPMARLIGVKSLQALADEASIAALRTLADDTDVAGLLDVGQALPLREVAVAACDAHALSIEFDAAAVAGQMSFGEAKLFADVAFGIVDLQGPRLRAEVLRQGRARMPATKTATHSGPPAPKPAGQPAP